MIDVLKNQFLDSFLNSIDLSTILLTMGVSFLFALYLYFAYLLTSDRVVYSKKFNITMSLVILITTAIILSMQSNIVLSLGMVGALSIVRFRTAIKEPRDLLFLFWSISLGIILGGGLFSIAIVLSILMTIGLLFFQYLPGNRAPVLLVVNCNNAFGEEEIISFLKNNKIKFRLKSRNANKNGIDLIYEIGAQKNSDNLARISINDNVENYNILTQSGEIQI